MPSQWQSVYGAMIGVWTNLKLTFKYFKTSQTRQGFVPNLLLMVHQYFLYLDLY